MKNISLSVLSMAAMLLSPVVSFSHTFQIETLINADGGGPNDVNVGTDNISLDYDSLGNLGMCYYDARNGDLKFALNDGNAWAIETAHADPGGDSVGSYCAIIFDDDDNPNIVYFNTTDSALLHAEKSGGRWTIRTVEMPVGVDMFGVNRVSLARDSAGDLGAAYYDRNGRDLKYAKFSNNRWTASVVRNAGDVGRYAALDFDSRNRPAIAYQDYTDMSTASLKFIAHNGIAWGAPETVDGTNNAGSYLSFKFDPNNKPHIIYRHFDRALQFYQVFYVNKVGAGWSERLALAQDSGPATGFYCQMVVDDSGTVHMSYMDSFLSALFPDANYLKFTSLYFVDRGPAEMFQMNDRLTVSVMPMVNYQGTAMAVHNIPANNNNPQLKQLTVAWAQDSGRDFDLVTAKLTNWSPVMVFTSPNANTHTGRDTFNVEWIDVDPDNNATISFERLDPINWASVPFRETAREDDANTLVLDISQVPRGDYRITSKIFDVDPNRYTTGWSPALLTVENHFPSAPNLAGPADRAVVDIATPTLQWGASTDVDNDAITYQVQLATDDAFANVIANGNNVANAQWAPNVLDNNAIYHWRVRAVDSEGGEGQWTAARQFSTNVPVVAAADAGGDNAAGGGNNANAGGGNAPAGGGNNAAGPVGVPVIGGGNVPIGAGGGGHAAAGGGHAAGGGNVQVGGGNAQVIGGNNANAGNAAAGGPGGPPAPANAAPASGGGCSLIRD